MPKRDYNFGMGPACFELFNSKQMVRMGEFTLHLLKKYANRCQEEMTLIINKATNGMCKNENKYLKWEIFENIKFEKIPDYCKPGVESFKNWLNNRLYCGDLLGKSKDSPGVFGISGGMVNYFFDIFRNTNTQKVSCLSYLEKELAA